MFVDKRLSSQQLYEQQKVIRQRNLYPPAPQIICCNLRTPENMASVLRVADAAASESVIFLHHQTSDVDEKKIKKISRSSDESVNWQIADLQTFKSHRPLIAIELTEQSHNVFNIALPDQCAFVVGNERHGVDDGLLQQCDYAVHIPMYGLNGSMNVSHALAIVLFEWRRQHA